MGVMYKLLKHRYNQQSDDYNYHNNNANNNNNSNNNNSNAISQPMMLAQEQQQQQQQQHQQQQQRQQYPHNGSELAKDLIKAKLKAREKLRRTITLEGNIVVERAPTVAGEPLPAVDERMMVELASAAADDGADDATAIVTATSTATATATSDVDAAKEFTAEHLLQLCKFLAERAKKNKHLCKGQQGQQQQQQQQQQRTQRATAIGAAAVASSHPPLVPDVAESRNLTTNSNFNFNSNSTTANSVMAQQQHSNAIGMPAPSWSPSSQQPHCEQRECGGKRDVLLLKIRRQIFERKRQRQLAAHVQQRLSAVWRPW